MLKFFFLSTTFFVREGETGGAAGGAGQSGAGSVALAGALAAQGGGDGSAGAGGSGDGDGGAPWYSDLPVEMHPTIQTKGWKDPAAVVDSYVNLEKLLGADRAGRTITLPTDKSTPEEIAAFQAKLGVPEKADGYEIKLPEGADPTFANSMRAAFKEAGIPKAAGEKIASIYQQQEAAAQQAFIQQSDADVRALQGEWGTEFEGNLEIAGQGARALGLGDPKLRDSLERAVGTKNMLTMLHRVGQMVSEHGGPRLGSDGSKGATFGLTKEAADSRIEQLKNDAEFQARLQSPNAKVREKAMEEWAAAFEARSKLG